MSITFKNEPFLSYVCLLFSINFRKGKESLDVIL